MITKPVIMREGEYKCRVYTMHFKLRDQQLKIIMYSRLLYQNPIITTKQKSIIDIHTEKKKNPNIILKIVIISEEKRTKEGIKRPTEI